jgi:hypothetical protein
MRLLLSRHLRHLAAASIMLLGTVGALSTTGVLAGTIGLPLGTSAACGCEASVVEVEEENETTGEEKQKGSVYKISPTEKVSDTYKLLWTWLARTEVKNSKLKVVEGTLWKEITVCGNGLYLPGDTCITRALIECLKEKEKLKAIQEIEIGAGVFKTVTIEGECLKK